MNLRELLKVLNIRRSQGSLDREITGIAYDSRLVEKDFVFVAIKGFSTDGHDYINNAIDRGATVIVAEKALDMHYAGENAEGRSISVIEVPDSRESLALLSAEYFRYPSERLSLIGITGTNGKTTTSYITKNILEVSGRRAGLIGTISYMINDREYSASNTTPESLELQRYLNEMTSSDIHHAVIEVSSHALVLKRVMGCQFCVAAFTNFSQDHLDFHKTMHEYFNAKAGLFGYLKSDGSAVLNIDDPAVSSLANDLKCNVVTCGIRHDAMFRARDIELRRNLSSSAVSEVPGLSFVMDTPSGSIPVESSLMGEFNIYNILLSAGIAYASGIGSDDIRDGIATARPVSGRFERIDEGQDFLCIVDYAHTDDALKNVISAARPVTNGRLITVFGCGGDRDRSKRALMGNVASELSDLVIVTSDNPRSEDPEGIIRDVLVGMKGENFFAIVDREEAIKEAVSSARKGDTLIIAGKGHEDYQEVCGRRYHFSDQEVVRREIKKIKNEKQE